MANKTIDELTSGAPAVAADEIPIWRSGDTFKLALSDLSSVLFPVAEVNIGLSDVATGNVSTAKHGFAPKAPNDATKFLDGTGAYSVPTGTATPTVITANTQTTSYTLVLTDAGKCVEMNSASALTLTVPPHSSVAWPDGTVIEVYAMGAGVVTVTAGGGVTIRNVGALAGQYKTARLRYRTADEWVLSGELA